MEELEDDIGLLFKNAFDGHKASPGDASWEGLNHSLGTRNFFRFNPYQFNIYYASSIIACLFICLGVGSHYTYRNWIEEKQPIVSVAPAPVYKGEGTATQELEETEEKPQSTQKVEATVEKKTSGKEATVDEMEALPKPEKEKAVSLPAKADSSYHIKSPATVHSAPRLEADSSAKPKRTLYITKRDTIFKVDTIKTHKKQKKWF